MKIKTLILAAAFGAVASFPLAAHHLCNAGEEVCPEDVVDLQGKHAAIFDSLTVTDEMGNDVATNNGAMALDPVDEIGNQDVTRADGTLASDPNIPSMPVPRVQTGQ